MLKVQSYSLQHKEFIKNYCIKLQFGILSFFLHSPNVYFHKINFNQYDGLGLVPVGNTYFFGFGFRGFQ